MWSSGNEVREQNRGKSGLEVSRKLTEIFHQLDATRPVTVGCNSPSTPWNGFADTVDVQGSNYKHYYLEFSKLRPDQPFYSSESSSCLSSRGEYFFPVSEQKDKGFFNYQVSSYDLYGPNWGSTPDREFMRQDECSAVAGEYVWTGFDYLGEPTPYNKDLTILLNFHSEAEKEKYEKTLGKMDGQAPSRSSYFGILDLCGFKKDRFYIYQARWRPELPMAHILPHWNWENRVGKVTPVHVYTSGDEAELFLNGKSLGKKAKRKVEVVDIDKYVIKEMPSASRKKANKDHEVATAKSKPGDGPNMNYYRLRWDDVVYEPGTLKVVAYKDGKKWAEDIVKTTGDAKKLELKADRNKIHADGRDLSYVTVRVVDKEGLMVPKSNQEISFSIDGPGEIVATGNGNSVDHRSFLSKTRNAYNGMCLVIVRSIEGETGAITLRAKSDGLESDEVVVRAE
jgi:beta-galactosidase